MIHHLLESISDDYSKYKDSTWTEDTITPKDVNDLREAATKTSKWDEDRLRLRLWEDWLAKRADLRAYWCEYGRVICLAPKESATKPTPIWIRAFRILGGGKPVRVLWFASDALRQPPPVGESIQPKHINGGYTNRCDAESIVIYREEEALRVLIHELLHASCSDPYDDDLTFLEADTEAWAEVTLVALRAKGAYKEFNILWDKQAKYAVNQAAAAEKFYNVVSSKDYGWRYLTGRLDRFASYNLPVYSIPESIEPLRSLRLTPKSLSD
jgi:hypothetical protein